MSTLLKDLWQSVDRQLPPATPRHVRAALAVAFAEQGIEDQCSWVKYGPQSHGAPHDGTGYLIVQPHIVRAFIGIALEMAKTRPSSSRRLSVHLEDVPGMVLQ
jgi:hypothetical protein